MFWVFLGLIIVGLFGAVMFAALRWLARLFASIFLAIMIAVPSGILLMEENENEVALALLLTVGLAAAIFWLLKPRSKPSALNPAPVPVMKPRSRPIRCGTFRMVLPGDQIDRIWDHLDEEAPHQAARIAVARRSTEQSRTALKARPLDTDAHAALIMLEKRMPEIIVKELNLANQLAAAARLRALDELVELVERIAADCERQRTTSDHIGSSETLILREHIERYLNRDRLQPFKP